MKIEIVYGELANLLGEHGSQQLLEQSFGSGSIIRTPYPQLPAFFEGGPDLVYMGPMTESTQRRVLDLWRDHKAAFEREIKQGTFFFFSGNALDLVGRTIRYEDAGTVEAMGLYPFDTYCQPFDRENEVILASYQDRPVMGFRSQFTRHTGDAGAFPFLDVRVGSGMNRDIRTEGIHDHNFFATSLLGPFLILNPSFTLELFRGVGYQGTLPFEEEMRTAEALRLEDLTRSFGKKRGLGTFIHTYLDKEKQILNSSGI